MATHPHPQSSSSSNPKGMDGAENGAKDTHSVSKSLSTASVRPEIGRPNGLETNRRVGRPVKAFLKRKYIWFGQDFNQKPYDMSGDRSVSAFPDGDNLFRWIGTINGPIGTVYEGLTYRLSLEFPSGYPYAAPTVKFTTPCYHPNVDHMGNICLDILKDKWSALYDVRTLLLSIQSLLAEPNNDSPLNGHAAELWADQEAYRKVLLEKYHQNAKSSVQIN